MIKVLKMFAICFLSIVLLFIAFEKGQQKVDSWEQETSLHGQGLR